MESFVEALKMLDTLKTNGDVRGLQATDLAQNLTNFLRDQEEGFLNAIDPTRQTTREQVEADIKKAVKAAHLRDAAEAYDDLKNAPDSETARAAALRGQFLTRVKAEEPGDSSISQKFNAIQQAAEERHGINLGIDEDHTRFKTVKTQVLSAPTSERHSPNASIAPPLKPKARQKEESPPPVSLGEAYAKFYILENTPNIPRLDAVFVAHDVTQVLHARPKEFLELVDPTGKTTADDVTARLDQAVRAASARAAHDESLDFEKTGDHVSALRCQIYATQAGMDSAPKSSAFEKALSAAEQRFGTMYAIKPPDVAELRAETPEAWPSASQSELSSKYASFFDSRAGVYDAPESGYGAEQKTRQALLSSPSGQKPLNREYPRAKTVRGSNIIPE